MGTYIAHFSERASGTCGPITDQVVQLSSGAGIGGGCALDEDDTYSSDECSLTRSVTCPLDGVPGTVSLVAISKEINGGAKFSGTESLKIYDGNGALQCVSTYDVTWTKQ